MKLETKSIIELVSVGAVVLTLIFVALELNQANTLAERDSRLSLSQLSFELNNAILEDSESIALMAKVRQPDLELTPTEYERAAFLVGNYLTFWGAINASYESELLPENVAEVYLEVIATTISQYPGLILIFEGALTDSHITEGNFEVFDRAWKEIRAQN